LPISGPPPFKLVKPLRSYEGARNRFDVYPANSSLLKQPNWCALSIQKYICMQWKSRYVCK
jgi:hypothetical protein